MKNLTRYALLTFATFTLGACTAGPDYERPEIRAPQNFVAQDVLNELNEKTKAQPFAADWWAGFHDDTLNELVETGLEENLEIAAALARVKEAKARIGLANSADKLRVNTNLDGEVQERREFSPDDDTTTSSAIGAGLGVGLPLDIFGRTQRDVERSRANLEAAEEELKATVLRVSSNITSEYLGLRGDQRQLELLRQSVELQEKTLSIVRARFESGLSPELDLQRATSSVESLRAQIPPLEERLQNSRNRLAVVTGQFPGTYEALLSTKSNIPQYQARIPDLLPLEVLNARPDVRQSEATLKAAIAAIGVAEADFYPSFDLAGSISIGTTGVSSGPATNALIASLSALIEQVITDGGARDANLEIAKAQAEEALANYALSLRNANEEVETSLNALHASAMRQKSLDIAVKASERSFAQAQILYRQGLISFLDVVDAQQELADDQQNLAAEHTDYATEIATLFRVLGTEIDSDKSMTSSQNTINQE